MYVASFLIVIRFIIHFLTNYLPKISLKVTNNKKGLGLNNINYSKRNFFVFFCFFLNNGNRKRFYRGSKWIRQGPID